MAESTLTVTYLDLLRVVGRYLGYLQASDTYADLSATELAECDDVVQSAYRSFLSPPPIAPGRPSHQWSFLYPTSTLSLVSGTADYDLPDGFGGLNADHLNITSTSQFVPILIRDVAYILNVRMGDSSTGDPEVCAIRPKAADPDGSTIRYQILFWPTPDGSYTVNIPYRALLTKLTTTNLYPLGGADHAETLRQFCLREAEAQVEDNEGIQAKRAMERLAASIAVDEQHFAPTHLGYCGDGSVFDTVPRFRSNLNTYNGLYSS